MTISETNPLLPKTVKDNGENTMTHATVATGCLIDAVGGMRQIGFATAASASLASSVAASAIATTAASMGLLCSGPLSMVFSATTTIPDAKSFVVKADWELFEAEQSCDKARHAVDPRVQSAKRMLTIRKIGVVNQSTLFAMGAIQTACGIVYMLGSEAASLFHFSTVLSGSVAVIASTVTSVALGAIYIFRGTMMIYRSCLALSLVGNFKKDFKACDTLAAKMLFLETEEARGQAYMQPRVDASCLEKTVNGRVCTMTALGYKFADGGTTQAYSNDGEKQEYVQGVEKGIFSEQLKHRLCATIGVTMIIGGALTLALTVLSHGIAPIAISLASAIFFMLAENIFLSYDAPQIFEKMRDRLFSFTQASASPRVESETAPLRHRDAFALSSEDIDAASTVARTSSVSSVATDLAETTLFPEIFAERPRAATA